MQPLIAFIYAAVLVAVFQLPASSTPTKCEFIAVELFEAVDRGDMTEEHALEVLERCNQSRFVDSM